MLVLKLMERNDPMGFDFVHKEGQKGKEKGNDKGKGKPKGKSKGEGKQNEKGKSSGTGKSNQESSKIFAGSVARQDTSGANGAGTHGDVWNVHTGRRGRSVIVRSAYPNFPRRVITCPRGSTKKLMHVYFFSLCLLNPCNVVAQ